jgi:hypothetical protein
MTIQRYDLTCGWSEKLDDGSYCLYSDVEPIIEENKRLAEERDELKRKLAELRETFKDHCVCVKTASSNCPVHQDGEGMKLLTMPYAFGCIISSHTTSDGASVYVREWRMLRVLGRSFQRMQMQGRPNSDSTPDGARK